MFRITACSLYRANVFFCSLGVLYGGLGLSKLETLIKIIKPGFRKNAADPQP
jgi:hypothetical protein